MTNSNKSKKDDESSSIMFIGKYDDYLRQLEEKVVGGPINDSSHPDVVKYQIKGYNWNAWVILGNVKPTLLLKKLISQMKIIILVFNAKKQETLTFLNEGWFHIIEHSIKNNPAQIRLLYGTQSYSEIDLKKLAPQIKEAVDKFKCEVYFDIKIRGIFGFKVNNNFFEFLKNQFSNKKQIYIDAITQNSFNKYDFNLKHVNLITKEAFKLEKEIFSKLNNLEVVQITSPSLTITSNCFNEAKNLQEFEFQGEQLTIEESCFKNCHKLTKFSLFNICYVRISSRIFEGCDNLYNFIIKPTTKIFLSNYFDNKGEIGSGQTGISYLAIEKGTNQTKRVKTLQASISTPKEVCSFFNYMILFSSVKSPAVLPIHGFGFLNFELKPQPTIVTDYIRGLSLEEALSNTNKLRLTETQRYIILLGITIGMEYLHSNNIIHNNLTPSNIILDEKFFPHINDYSMMNPNLSRYTAPEIFNNKSFSFKADVYSYSIIAYELITCKRPFEGYKLNDFIQKVLVNGERPDLKLIQDKNIHTLLNRCWSATPSNRPLFNSILNEIIKEQYINIFGAKRFEVESYLYNFGIKHKYANVKPINSEKKMNMVQIKNNKDNDAETEDDENTEEEDLEEDEIGEGVVFTSSNNVVYRISDKNHIAHVIESPKANGDIIIERNVQFKSSKYTVTRICEKAFQSTKIKSLSFAPNSKVRKICNLAFDQSLLESLSIPSSLNKIEEQSFYGCDNLKKIEIDPRNNYFINRKEFLLYKNKTENKNAPSEEMIFSLKDFHDYQYKNYSIKFIRSQKLFSFNAYSQPVNIDFFRNFIKCQNIQLIDLICYQKIEIIENFFCESKNIQDIKFVSKDLNVNNFGFKNLTNVSVFSFEKLEKAKFGSNAFSGCESLPKFEIAAFSKLELCDECFHGNINLQTLKVNSPYVIIGKNCFMGCNSLSSVSFLNLESIKIGSNAFSGCESLKEFKLKVESNLEFEEYCFSRAINLQRVEITGIEILIIEQGSFENCSSLTSISFPDAIEVNFGRKSFSGCTKLNKISLPKAESICFEEFCFERDKNISPIYLNCINLTIHENSFDKSVPISRDKLSKIRKLELHINNLNPFSSMIDQCKSLESITIKINQIGSITQNSFNKIGFNLKHVNLITKEAFKLEKEIFAKLNKLEVVQITSPSLTITSNCFNEAKNLQEFEFQGEQLTIEESCFKNCHKLTKFSLFNICYVRISSKIFEGCDNLNDFIIKPTTKIDLNNYFDNEGEIGSGQTGISYLAIEKETNQTKRVKTLQAALSTDEEVHSFFFHMISLSSVKSPVVSAIHGFHFIDFGQKLQPTIVTDYIRGHSLEEALSNTNKLRLTGTQRYIILLGITIGMEYLHSNNIIHNNLTPSNIILDENFFPHINDYSMMNPNGNKYTAPEIFYNKPFSYEADVYSYSIIAYELITCKRPFEGYKMNDFVQKVIEKGKHPNLTLIKDTNVQSLLNRCWSATTSSRPSFDSILDEIINEQYINTFGANRFEVETYLRNFGIKLKYAKEKPRNAKSGMNTKLSGSERSLEIQKQIEPQPKISQSSNNSKNSELIITRYLRSKLFDENVPIKRFSISDKTKLSGNLRELSDKILKPGKKSILFFTIEYASNYIVKYYKGTDPIQSLGSYLNIQIKPAIGKEYRICVLCDISKIKNDTNINRDYFTFAITFIDYQNVKEFVNKIMSYIDPSKKARLPNPQLYAFENSKFINIVQIRDIQNEEMPIFVSWGGKQYNQILDIIYEHVHYQDGFDL